MLSLTRKSSYFCYIFVCGPYFHAQLLRESYHHKQHAQDAMNFHFSLMIPLYPPTHKLSSVLSPKAIKAGRRQKVLHHVTQVESLLCVLPL